MSATSPILVVGQDGWQGTIEGAWEEHSDKVQVLLADGRILMLDPALLEERAEGQLYAAFSLDDVEAALLQEGEASRTVQVIPVVEERLRVAKRQVEQGRVRISKTVESHEEMVDLPLLREEVVVERVPVNRYVEGTVGIRHEGETTIIPLVEEVLVVEKRLLLREEIHVTKRQSEFRQPQSVTLRREQATVERVESAPDDPQGGSA